MHQIQVILDLWCKLIPQLEEEINVGSGKGGNEHVLESLDGLFCTVDLMIVGFDKLQFALIFHWKLFDLFCGLIVHDVQSGFDAFDGEFVKILFVLLEYCLVGKACDWRCQNCIWFKTTKDKESYATIEGYEQIIARQVMIDNTTSLIGNCAKTKNFCNWFAIVQSNQGGALSVAICPGYARGSLNRGKMGATNSGASCGNSSIVFEDKECMLLMPWCKCFMWPLAVAWLGFKYLRINILLIFGHPFKKPCCVAFKSVEIWGLHNNWCANFTAFACVLTKCVSMASAGWREGWGARPI